jgi:toxin YhaV
VVNIGSASTTLGEEHKHWFRAKFFQQCRLFFRFHAPSKLIVLAWVNDEETQRAYESNEDAYRVFRKMMASGHPPDEWDQLIAQARPQSLNLKTGLARHLAQHQSTNLL